MLEFGGVVARFVGCRDFGRIYLSVNISFRAGIALYFLQGDSDRGKRKILV
jgi:hypothetical protein